MPLSHHVFWLPAIIVLIALGALAISLRGRRVTDIHVYGALFIAGIAFFFVRKLVGDKAGLISDIAAIGSMATCGWSWLLSRALFRRPDMPSSLWPVGVVVFQTLAGALLWFSGDDTGGLSRMADNGLMLVSSTVLLLSIAEPLRGYRRDMPKGEQRFRLSFACGTAIMIVVSSVWIGGSPAGSLEAQWGSMVRIICATTAVMGAGLAIWYRSRAPMAEPVRTRQRPVSTEEEALAARVRYAISDEALFTEPALKVSDLARRLNEAEYKVTQCITGALGFRNFNHMINHFRIAQARESLSDRRCDHLPVLTIALDCGFGSIGPFNRAFKAEVGMTPTAFRDAQRAIKTLGAVVT